MKILQIYELNPLESIGGVEIAILNLSKELARRGHEVSILTGAGSGNGRAGENGLKVMTCDLFGSLKHTYLPGRLTILRQLLFASALLSRKIRACFDIYHGHVYSSGLLATRLASQNGGVAVNTIHGSYYPVWNMISDPLAAFFYKTAEKRLASLLSKKADLQIHVSTYFAEQVQSWSDSERIRVIPNGVDPGVFSPKVERSFTSDLPVVLTARRLVRKNGVEYLIKAMESLKGECRLVIVGEGPERRRLEALAKGREDIVFLGSVPHEKMPGVIASADVTVVPSIIEASSLFMLEAMSMEKPVVAASVGGLPETLGNEGLLVPSMSPEGLAGAIHGLLCDEGMRRRLGDRARKRILKHYTWEKIGCCVEEEYLRLLDRGADLNG